MNGADFAVVFIDEKTFLQKKMKPFSKEKVLEAFNNKNLKFFNQPEKIKSYLQTFQFSDTNLLMMSSGNFGGINLVILTKLLINN
jgi:UDP-N-acetylmuramate: L-alanyl-gamma-D-glutamyl-meso-diaminopimelate ligase